MKKISLLFLSLLILTGCSMHKKETETTHSSFSIDKNKIIDSPDDLNKEPIVEPESADSPLPEPTISPENSLFDD